MCIDQQTLLNIQLAGVKSNKPTEMTLFILWLQQKLNNPEDTTIDNAFDSNWIKIWETANINWPFPVEVKSTEIEKKSKKATLILKLKNDINLKINNLNFIYKPKVYSFKNLNTQNITSFINADNGYEAINQESLNCGVNLQDQETKKIYTLDFESLGYEVVSYE